MYIPELEKIQRALFLRDCRDNFYQFRLAINPKMKRGWWQKQISDELQQFYYDLIAGKRPKLVIEAPPQHGKSTIVVEFIAWVAGKNPDFKTVYASVSERLGVRANLKLQRLYDTSLYREIFPDTRINSSNIVTISGQSLRNREILEYVGYEGYFRNTTVRGQLNGEGMDFGIVDDPIKGRAEANSDTIRDSTWDWLTDVFLSRLSEDSGTLFILTRWHVDDPVGRLIAKLGNRIKVIKYPALALKGAKLMDNDPRIPGDGEALFPEHKSSEFILEQKSTMASTSFEALYQQNPQLQEGEIIKRYWIKYYQVLPEKFDRMIQSWDCGIKDKDTSDYVAGHVWGKFGGKFYLVGRIHKQLGYEGTVKAVRYMTNHFPLVGKKIIEDKANGSPAGEVLKQSISGIELRNPKGSKLERVKAVEYLYEAGDVYFPDPSLKVSSWDITDIYFSDPMIKKEDPSILDVIDEICGFPAESHDDDVDAMTQALLELAGLTGTPTYSRPAVSRR